MCDHESEKVTILGTEWDFDPQPPVRPLTPATFQRPYGVCECGQRVRLHKPSGTWIPREHSPPQPRTHA